MRREDYSDLIYLFNCTTMIDNTVNLRFELHVNLRYPECFQPGKDETYEASTLKKQSKLVNR